MIEISDQEFSLIQGIMYRRTGVQLKPTKKPLVMSRLRTRLEELKLSRFADYAPLVERDNSQELQIFVNALTTNETYFFRHAKQFNFLYEKVLPEMVTKQRSSSRVSIWSGASSSGEEPYSIAITCKEFFKARPGWKFHLVASDINTEVIAEAREGIYSERSIKEVPESLKTRYFRPFEGSRNRMWKEFNLDVSVKSCVNFVQHNLLKSFSEKEFDVIFLRNVMIYFDNASKQKVVDNVLASLAPGGYFFISLSESLNDVRTSLKAVHSGVYQK